MKKCIDLKIACPDCGSVLSQSWDIKNYLGLSCTKCNGRFIISKDKSNGMHRLYQQVGYVA